MTKEYIQTPFIQPSHKAVQMTMDLILKRIDVLNQIDNFDNWSDELRYELINLSQMVEFLRHWDATLLNQHNSMGLKGTVHTVHIETIKEMSRNELTERLCNMTRDSSEQKRLDDSNVLDIA